MTIEGLDFEPFRSEPGPGRHLLFIACVLLAAFAGGLTATMLLSGILTSKMPIGAAVALLVVGASIAIAGATWAVAALKVIEVTPQGISCSRTLWRGPQHIAWAEASFIFITAELQRIHHHDDSIFDSLLSVHGPKGTIVAGSGYSNGDAIVDVAREVLRLRAVHQVRDALEAMSPEPAREPAPETEPEPTQDAAPERCPACGSARVIGADAIVRYHAASPRRRAGTDIDALMAVAEDDRERAIAMLQQEIEDDRRRELLDRFVTRAPRADGRGLFDRPGPPLAGAALGVLCYAVPFLIKGGNLVFRDDDDEGSVRIAMVVVGALLAALWAQIVRPLPPPDPTTTELRLSMRSHACPDCQHIWDA
jgi:hypothetical protein